MKRLQATRTIDVQRQQKVIGLKPARETPREGGKGTGDGILVLVHFSEEATHRP